MKRLIKVAAQRVVNAFVLLAFKARLSEEDPTYEPITDTLIAPPVTHEMAQRGTTWARTVEGGWREVCDTCGGNCGQCGMTGRLGNPGFSLDRIIAKTGMNNPPAGLPRG